VRDEASRAQRRGVYLPVRLEKVDPPLGFGETHALSLHGWKGDRADPRYQAVLSAARNRLEIATEPHPGAVSPSRISRRAVIAGAAVATASVAGLGAWFLAGPAKASLTSIAVLPFANLSGDPAQAYFSDGMAEELRSALSRIAGLQVVARTSSELVRDADVTTAAGKLGVHNILTGSVRRSPTMIRVATQLIDGDEGLERWSEIYDRKPGDALQIQSDIADKVAQALSIQLGGADRRRVVQGGTRSADAHELVLKAEAMIQQREGREGIDRSLGMLEAALALDPKYADAVAMKSRRERDRKLMM
jgi:serine/threonine-protein kinase